MKCQRCNGTAKLYRVYAKCSDQCSIDHHNGKVTDGYVPDWIGEYGDYVSFTVCRHCGQVQGSWPELDKSIKPFKHGKAS